VKDLDSGKARGVAVGAQRASLVAGDR